jgi:hypothetical protein
MELKRTPWTFSWTHYKNVTTFRSNVEVIVQIGERSSAYSNICGRNESNMHDVASSLKDLDLNFNQLYEYCHQFNADNLSAFDIGILFL